MDIELADAVAAVREELLDAAGRGCGQQIMFAVGPIEMEFAVELRADVKAKAGFKAWVMASAEIEGGASRGRTHTVRMTLTPKHRDGTDLMIATDTDTDTATTTGPGDLSGHIGR